MTIEAQEKIMELREAAMELQEENLKLRGKVTEMEAEIQKSKNLKHDGEVYSLEGDRTPFCPVCYDNRGKLIHLIKDEGNYGRTWYCPVCLNPCGAITN